MFAMKDILRFIFLLLFQIVVCQGKNMSAQEPDSNGYRFTTLWLLDATPVKNQYNSSTCWSYSVISMLESELLRLNKGIYDLSEMFIVRHVYPTKAEKFVRMHGHINFTPGGAANDVTDAIKKYGIVPEPTYPAVKDNLIFGQVDSSLKQFIHGLISVKNDTLDSGWYNEYMEILDSWLGALPDTFKIDSTLFTPEGFAEELDLDMDDYILITSFTHHPFYSEFILEVPDNWSWGKVYNVPLEELIEIIDTALYNKFTVVWSADISEKGFSFADGLAVLPEINDIQKSVTQELRQEGFDNYTTTDDHGMHIVGIAEDQNRTKYYYVKNSWGTGNPYLGYMYVSEAYVKYKTMSIMLNKDALPERIAKKLFH